MLTGDNYKSLMFEYKRLKELAIHSGLSAVGFINELNRGTEFSDVYLKFFKAAADNGDIQTAVSDFVEVVYGVKISNPLTIKID